MAEYRIDIGGITLNDPSIRSDSIDIATSVDLPGAELTADVFTVVVEFEAGLCYLWSPADYNGVLTADGKLFGTADTTTGDLTQMPYGTPILLYDGDALISKFYVRNVVRVGRTLYKVNAMSAIGFLERTRHMGGVYTNKTVAELIGEIVNGAFTYTINSAIASQLVVGWLPIDTARNNLHKLLFALGIAVIKDENGNIVFTFLSGEYPSDVGDERIFVDGSVDYSVLATAVEVTEHAFYKGQSTPAEQIFSNAGGVAANNLFVSFPRPYYSLSASGLTIVESGDNYAKVSGVGTLSGIPYVHETRVLRQNIPDATGLVPNVVTSEEDTLVNSINALNVLARLVAYYGSRKNVSADIILAGEKAGDTVSFTDAFGDETTGIITQMDMRASSFVKARCRIITDYTPTGQGNYYTNHVLIDTSGTWTVPAGVTAIRIAVIGGGTGGAGGYDGEIGAGDIYDPDFGDYGDQRWVLYDEDDEDQFTAEYSWYPNQPLKKGGAGGTPGSPGKIYVIDATVEPGEVITASLGAGGAGGAKNGVAGSAGTATTVSSASLGSISSESGVVTPHGFMDVFSGLAFGLIGSTGYDGGDGGQTDAFGLRGGNGYAGLSGGDVLTYTGGAGGAGVRVDQGVGDWAYASGGGGGGAAYGHNGGAGGDGSCDDTDVTTGSGGKGADADPPSQAYYGCGGDGGNGGGAGGNAGAGRFEGMYPDDTYHIGNRGQAGQGSVGGAGGNGAVIIYY